MRTRAVEIEVNRRLAAKRLLDRTPQTSANDGKSWRDDDLI